MVGRPILLCVLLHGAGAFHLRNAETPKKVDVSKLNIGRKVIVPTQKESKAGCGGDRYCIRELYQSQQNKFFDNTTNKDEWQLQVYQYARAVADQLNFRKVADVGCGSGYKLVQYLGDFDTTGYDLEPTLTWLKNKYPSKKWKLSNFGDKDLAPADLVISADVVEHIPDANAYMAYLLQFDAQYYVVSTPDRFYGTLSQFGPPVNPAHVREWTHNEFANYANTHGFRVLDARVYEPQHTMWFLLEKDESQDNDKWIHEPEPPKAAVPVAPKKSPPKGKDVWGWLDDE